MTTCATHPPTLTDARINFLIELLTDSQPLSVFDILDRWPDHIPGDRGNLRPILAAGYYAGLWKRCGRGRARDPFRFWREA